MKPVLGTKAIAAREAIAGLADDVRDPLELLAEVRDRVRRVVPNSGGAWMVTDPQTVIPTAVVGDNSDPELSRRLFEYEMHVPDVGLFADLHRRGVVSMTLHEATGGRPELSPRYRGIRMPAGLGPELRLLFRTGQATWGMSCVSREAGEPDFDEEELAWLRSIAPHVAHGLRSTLARPVEDPAPPWAPGMLVLDEFGEIEYSTGGAEKWLSHMPVDPGYELPPVMLALAMQARAEALGAPAVSDLPAHARMRLRNGAWLHVHAAALHDAGGEPVRTAVMLEPADRAQLLAVLVQVHGLTEREREVTELLLAGLPIEDIARRMSISRHTLRDHVKSVFAKVGVASRPELTARFLPEFA